MRDSARLRSLLDRDQECESFAPLVTCNLRCGSEYVQLLARSILFVFSGVTQ